MSREGYKIPAQNLRDDPESLFRSVLDADAHIMAFKQLTDNHDANFHELFPNADLQELFDMLDILAMHAQYVRAWIAS